MKQCLATAGGLADTTVGALPAAPVTNAVGAMDMGVLPDCYPGGIALTEGDAIKTKWGDTAPLEKGRSEERRGGKEGRSRWSPYH